MMHIVRMAAKDPRCQWRHCPSDTTSSARELLTDGTLQFSESGFPTRLGERECGLAIR
jgi:hypothetical protein